MQTPHRIRYRRGHALLAGAVFVARPSKWGNPHRLDDPTSRIQRERAVDAYRRWLHSQPELIAAARNELAGRDLACYCPLDGLPCHADELLLVANPAGAIAAITADPWACARHRVPAGEHCALCEDQTELLPLADITGLSPWNGTRA